MEGLLFGALFAATLLVIWRWGLPGGQGSLAERLAQHQGSRLLAGGRRREPSQAAELPEAVAAELRELIAAGRTIEAIKLHRRATGSRLGEAKAAVERLANDPAR